MQYRPARVEEIEQLAQLRKQQLIDEGQQPVCNMDRELHTFFAQGMQEDTGATITIDEDVLNLGSIECPNCGETLEFEGIEEDEDEPDDDGEDKD